jgi:predicted permease
MSAWIRDLRRAARSLARAPGFTLVATATLALAIGANTAIFSVVDTVLLDPLPFPDPDQLVSIRGTAPGSDLSGNFGLGAEFMVEYRENATTLVDIALAQVGQTTVNAGDEVERLFVSAVSPSLFSTLRVDPEIGRLPSEEDDEGQVAVLSYWLWTDWFGRDPAVLGEIVNVSGVPRTVVGVMGPEFRFPSEDISLWIHDLITEPVTPGGFGLNLIGRMAPGADHDALRTELDALADRLPERFGGSPAYARTIDQFQPVIRSVEEQLVGDIQGPLWILLGTVAVVLLIACANVANLMAVRTEGRNRDLAVRRALGASRLGLIRTQMAEALILAFLGGAGGILLAAIGVPLVVLAAPEGVPRLNAVDLDLTALVFTGGVAVLAACGAGLLPAIRFSGSGVLNALRHSGRVGTGPSHLTRDVLVVLETAAALVLLVGSGLLVESFRALNQVDPGFDTENILSFQMAPNGAEHGLIDGPTYAAFHYGFMDRLRAVPGVESVGVVNTLPLDEGAGNGRVSTRFTNPNGEDDPLVRVTFTGGDYFQTMGIGLLAGEYFEPRANPSGDVTVIVSDAAARLLWPGEDPLGQELRPSGNEGPWMRVQGVVENVMLADFRQSEPDALVYLPMVGPTAESWAVGTPAYVVRSDRAETIAPEIREIIRQVTPDAPMYRIFTMRALAARSMAALSFTMLTVGIAAGLALILGAVGLYGVLSYTVSQRTREIGIRMALGAEAGSVRRLVVVQGARLAVIGVVIGLAAAFFLTRVLESLLFGVESIHPATFAAMSTVMVGVAFLASYGPARRASLLDPIAALRAE